MKASNVQIIHMAGCGCISNVLGAMPNLTSSRLRGNCQYHSRCPSRGCQMRVTWARCHPLLQSGPASLDLRTQASIFLGITLGCTQHTLSIQLGLPRSTIQWYVDKLKHYICKVVKKEQDMITYGTSTDDWDEVEVDEVTLSKVRVGLVQFYWHDQARLSWILVGFTSSWPPDYHQSSWTGSHPKQSVERHRKGQDWWQGHYPPHRHEHIWGSIGEWPTPALYIAKSGRTGTGQNRSSRSMSRRNAGDASKSSDLVPRSLKGKWGGHGSEQDLEAAIRWVQWKYWFQGQDLFRRLGNAFKTNYWLG